MIQLAVVGSVGIAENVQPNPTDQLLHHYSDSPRHCSGMDAALQEVPDVEENEGRSSK